MNRVEPVRNGMISTSSESSWVAARAVQAGSLVKISRGQFLASDVLAGANDDMWEQRNRLDIARILSVADRGRNGWVVAFESALMIHGLPVLEPTHDVHVVGTGIRSADRDRFPAATLAGTRIAPGGELKRHWICHDHRGTEEIEGVTCTDAVTTAVDLARFRPVRQAVAEISVLMNQVCKFDRASPSTGREAERQFKQRCLDMLEAVGRARGSRRAQRIVLAADAGCESIAEGVLIWFLHAHGARPWRTQVPTDVGSRTVYPDVLIDEVGTVLESEGRAKLGVEAEEAQKNAQALLVRSNELNAVGLKVVFLPAADILGSHRVLAHRLHRLAPEIFEAGAQRDSFWFQG